MRTGSVGHRGRTGRPWINLQGFTLTQLLVASTIFLLVVLGMISGNFFGLRLMEVTQTKLGANDTTRKVLSKLEEDIQGARTVLIGTGSAASMSTPAAGASIQGNAIQLCISTNTNSYIRYYVDRGLNRITNGGTATVLVPSVTNAVAFRAESFRGTVLTNAQNTFVVGVTLQFSEIPSPRAPLGSNMFFQSFQIQTRVSRRSVE